MTEATIAEASPTEPSTPKAINLPPGPRLPMFIQGFAYAVSRTWTINRMVRRYGDVFTMTLPVFGRSIVVADPQLAKQLFTANTDDVGNIQPNLSRILGPGSVFALDGADHKRRRRLLTPPLRSSRARAALNSSRAATSIPALCIPRRSSTSKRSRCVVDSCASLTCCYEATTSALRFTSRSFDRSMIASPARTSCCR